MKEVIDLYAKLLIGTFSFIGPSFTLLISVFYDAIQRAQTRHRAQINNLQRITAEELANDDDFQTRIEETGKQVKNLIKRNRRELCLLNPRRQVRRLFVSLFSAIILVGFYYFQHSHFWSYDNLLLREAAILLSSISFVYCIRVLWQIFCTIIRIKTDEKESKQTSSLRAFE